MEAPTADHGPLARTWQIILAVFGVLGFALALRQVDAYLDHKIDARMSDPAFIRQVASQVRPALIFDSNGSILYDMGAGQYFDEISVNLQEETEKKAGVIILKPKMLLTFPPEITGMGGVQIFPAAQRGPGLTWHYDVDAFYLMKADASRPYRFRLEVIK